MGFRGSLGTVDKVEARRPAMLIGAALGESITAAVACRAVAAHTSLRQHAAGQLSSGVTDLGMWLLWTLALGMWLFVTPGWLKFSAAERRRLDDELVTQHRSTATRVAFTILALAVVGIAVANAAGHAIPWAAIASLAASLTVGALVFAGQELRANA